jgi:hypothetical protein
MKTKRKAKKARGYWVTDLDFVNKVKLRDVMLETSTQVKRALQIASGPGITIEQMSKTIGVAQVVDQLVAGLPASHFKLRGKRVWVATGR